MSDLWVVATFKNGPRLLRHFLTMSTLRTLTKEYPVQPWAYTSESLRILRFPEYPQDKLQGRSPQALPWTGAGEARVVQPGRGISPYSLSLGSLLIAAAALQQKDAQGGVSPHPKSRPAP